MENIDRIVHEPAMLAILRQLSVIDSADFLFLRSQTGLSGGNLSSHSGELESAGDLEINRH